jgi:uncharacterized membrane protein
MGDSPAARIPSSSPKLEAGSSGRFNGTTIGFLTAWRNRIRLVARSFGDPYVLCILVSFLLYAFYWSQLTIARFEGLHAHILDLGVYAQSSAQVYQGPFNVQTILGAVADNGIVYLVFPLEAFHSYPLLLIWQSLCIGSSAIAIFLIARRTFSDSLLGLLLGEAFLLYFPVGGINWFDMHYEIYFMPLFLFGYYFYLREQPGVAYVFLALSATAQFPFGVFTLVFAVANLIGRRLPKPLSLIPSPNRIPLRYDVALSVFSVLILVTALVNFQIGLGSAGTFLHTTPTPGVVIPTSYRWTTFLLFYGPFLFLPLLSRRWIFCLLPYLYLLATTQTPAYVYPTIFFDQYGSAIVPFLFLGFIDSVRSYFSRQDIGETRAPTGETRGWRRLRQFRHGPIIGGATCIVVVALLGLSYSPYGPYNADQPYNFGLPGNIQGNTTIESAYSQILGLIPSNAPDLLVQNNMPQAFPRPVGNNNTILVTGSTLAYNFTYLYRDQWRVADITYVLTDPWDYTFSYAGAYPYNMSMERAVTELYAGGSFGLEAEAYGLMLLERNYTGPLRYYVPMEERYSAADLFVVNPSYRMGPIISANDVLNQSTVWFGPYTSFLQPGLYNITYSLLTNNVSPSNFLKLDVWADNGVLLNSTRLTGNRFPVESEWTSVSVQVYINNFVTLVNLAGDDVVWKGTIELAGINVSQVGAASTRFVLGTSEEYKLLYEAISLLPVGSTVLTQPSLSPLRPGLKLEFPTNYKPAAPPAFVLGDPFQPDFDLGTPTNASLSLSALATRLFGSGNYGVLAELSGIFVLEAGYRGVPAQFRALNQTYPASSLSVVYNQYRDGSKVTATNVLNFSTLWFGPYSFLQVGRYVATYSLLTSNTSVSNFIDLDVWAGLPLGLLNVTRITGANFTVSGAWENISVEFIIPNFYNNCDFSGDDVHWGGTLSLAEIRVVQLAS